jgi:hypothetical protein
MKITSRESHATLQALSNSIKISSFSVSEKNSGCSETQRCYAAKALNKLFKHFIEDTFSYRFATAKSGRATNFGLDKKLEADRLQSKTSRNKM